MSGDELLKTGPRSRVDNGQPKRPLCDFSQDHSAGKATAGLSPKPMKSALQTLSDVFPTPLLAVTIKTTPTSY
jgi:hypothetical protein